MLFSITIPPSLSTLGQGVSDFQPGLGQNTQKNSWSFSDVGRRIKAWISNNSTLQNISNLFSWMARNASNPLPALSTLDQRSKLYPPPHAFAPPSVSNNIQAHRDLLRDPGNADLEVFVKKTICESLQKDQTFKMKREDGGVDTYTVYKKIAGKGLVSYALTPDRNDLPPLLVFRCTEPDFSKEMSLESIQNDFNVRLGQSGWNAVKGHFDNLMNDQTFRPSNQKIKVAGYSLGGVHAQHFIAKHHENVKHGIFYSAPSAPSDVARNFAKEINSANRRDDPLTLQIFRTTGDVCHHVGDKQLGCGVNTPNARVTLFEASIPGDEGISIFPSKTLEKHAKLVCDKNKVDFKIVVTTDPKDLERELNNIKRKPYLEFFRVLIGPSVSEQLNIVERTAKHFQQLF